MGLTEIGLILFIALLLFGPEDLPVIAKAIGKTVRQFRKLMNGLTGELSNAMRMQSDTKTDSAKDTFPKETDSQEPKQMEDTNVLQSSDGEADNKSSGLSMETSLISEPEAEK